MNVRDELLAARHKSQPAQLQVSETVDGSVVRPLQRNKGREDRRAAFEEKVGAWLDDDSPTSSGEEQELEPSLTACSIVSAGGDTPEEPIGDAQHGFPDNFATWLQLA